MGSFIGIDLSNEIDNIFMPYVDMTKYLKFLLDSKSHALYPFLITIMEWGQSIDQ